jgi:hypothetical protein
MSETELIKLERDVIQARARFAGDLAVLRSPDTVADFKDDVQAKAMGIKDDLMNKARTSVTETTNEFIADLKGRANANPGAVLAIGAGLAWHFVRNPPITSALLGYGLWSLLRTTPAPEGEGFGPRAVELAHATRDKVEDLRAQASEAVSHLADQATATADQVSTSVRRTVHNVQDAAMAAAGSVRETVHDAQDAAMAAAGRVSTTTRDTASQLRRESASLGDKASALAGSAGERASALAGSAGELASSAGERASALASAASEQAAAFWRRHADEVASRDTLLLGAAALAVTAAVGIAYQRRD